MSTYYSRNREKIRAKRAARMADPEAREKVREYNRGYRVRTRERRKEYDKQWFGKNPNRMSVYSRRHHLKKTFGLTEEQYEALLVSQDGVCAVCGKPPKQDRKLAIDHCHHTGKIRGLLCNACNLGIGKLGDTAECLERALKYLTKDR